MRLKSYLKDTLIKNDKKLIDYCSFDRYYKIQKAIGFPHVISRFQNRTGYEPNLTNPQSFNEKCTYLKLYSRNPILPLIADKYKVRDYVCSKVGQDISVPLLQVVDRAEDIDFDRLPDQFIVKTNFTSGLNILVDNKSELDINHAVSQLNTWMKMKYGYQKLIWFAQQIERKIVVEELLKDSKGNIPFDYKFYVFKGDIRVVEVDFDRFNNHTRSFFDPDWNLLPIGLRVPRGRYIAPPQNLAAMLDIVKLLGQDFDFMRVDLYSLEDQVYFGELTPGPVNCCGKFENMSSDYELGECWEMDLRYLSLGK